jgi:hypothetical protein
MEDTVRWSVKVSKETDKALRAHLGASGGRKGDLSRFVQEAVRERLKSAASRPAKRSPANAGAEREIFASALQEIRSRTRGLSRRRFERLIAKALAYARKRR